MNEIEILQNYIDNAQYIVFFGGAGVSTESGIPDFRSKDGLYNQKYKYPPERILSHSFFENHPLEFFTFYKDKMNATSYAPNITHIFLKKLEERGKLKAIVTQNIDGLHSKAGNHNILELHGSIYQNTCQSCHKKWGSEKVFSNEKIPRCTCGGIIKPDVVLYEEPLDNAVWQEAVKHIEKADLLIIAGTSLTVYPAKNLLYSFHGKHLVLLNRDMTAYDKEADLVLHNSLGNIFGQLK